MDFLYIITKQEFTSLYRFGFIPVIQEKILKLKGLSEKVIETAIIKSFMALPFFVGDEEYLFISFNKFPNGDNKIQINDVLEIIPLTSAARHSYQMKFDKKIVFSHARFEKVITKVEEQIDIEERLNGAKAFWTLCKVQRPFCEIIDSGIIKEAYQKRIEGVKSDSFSSDFFVHTLVYERYEPFPKSKLGYFYDLGEIFAHMNSRPTFRGTSYYQFLEKAKNQLTNAKTSSIIEFFENQEETEKIRKALTKEGLRKYLVAIIFFEFKESLSDSESIHETKISDIVKQISNHKDYKTELNYAIYLTGLFFGYGKFYDDLYELIDLNIFKTQEKPLEKTKKEVLIKEPIESNIITSELKNETSLKPQNDSRNKFQLTKEEEAEKVDTKNDNAKNIINQVKDLIKKHDGKIEVTGDVYKKDIKNIITKNIESATELKNKDDYLKKLNELSNNHFEIDLKKKTIRMRGNMLF